MKKRKAYADSRGVSMTDEQYAEMRAFAEKMGITFSALMRFSAEHAMKCPAFKKWAKVRRA